MTERGAWIWDTGEASPRNGWRCFRRDIESSPELPGAILSITADTQYIVWVNGVEVARGPARGHTHRWQLDRVDVSDQWRPGGPNSIAVLVHHLGVSTFSYRRARGGLIARLEDPDGEVLCATDRDWLVATHTGYEARAPRMSMQLGFSEIYDARLWSEDWTTQPPVGQCWVRAAVIGDSGVAPWGDLVPASTPQLTANRHELGEAIVTSTVEPFADSRVVDLRAAMIPDSADHADRLAYAGFLLGVIGVAEAGEVILVHSDLDTPNGHAELAIDGAWVGQDSFSIWAPRSRAVRLHLAAGNHTFALDVSRRDQGLPFRLNLAGPATFSTLGTAREATEFVVVGPYVGTETTTRHPNKPLHPDVCSVPATDREQVLSLTEAPTEQSPWTASPLPIRPVNPANVSPVDVATSWSSPLSRRQGSGGRHTELLFDLGRRASGSIRLEVDAPAGTMFDVGGLEHVESGRREYPNESDGTDNTVRYVARAGKQRFTTSVRRGFRWVQVVVHKVDADDEIDFKVVAIDRRHPVTTVGDFACSNPDLTRIWQMSRDTLSACMLDTYVDSPLYEQAAWVGDLWSAASGAAPLFAGADGLTRHGLQLAADSTKVQPLLNSHSVSGWDNVIPNWSLLWVLACRDHWRRTGDRAWLRKIWPTLESVTNEFLGHLDERGLLSITAWNFLDWAPIDQPDEGVVTHQNCLLVLALEVLASLADELGSPKGDVLRQHASEVREAVNRWLWSDTDEAYVDCLRGSGAQSVIRSVHSQVMALFCGVAPSEYRNGLLGRIVEPPPHWVRVGSPWMTNFVYPVLAEHGFTRTMVETMLDDFSVMLEKDAITCWETFPRAAGEGRLTRSHCHAWSAVPAAALTTYVLGVRPTSPGWTHIEVQPQPSGLDWARGTVLLPDGSRMHVEWVSDERGLELSVRAPEWVQIDARLPSGVKGTVSLESDHRSPASDG